MNHLICEFLDIVHAVYGLKVLLTPSTVKESSVIAVQIFDQRKFKRRDQGFLGVVNIRVSDVLDLELDSHRACYSCHYPLADVTTRRICLIF